MSTDSAVLKLAYAVGTLARDQLFGGKLLKTRVTRIVYLLETYCLIRKWDYEEIVLNTWTAVKQRDWIKYPDTGLPPEVAV